METIQLQLEPRSAIRKGVRRLRHQGITPVHVYGRGLQPIAAQAESRTLQRAVAQAGRNTPVGITGLPEVSSAHPIFVREVQRDPISGSILHVDFFQVEATQRVEGEVPITIVGEAPAVRLLEGLLVQNLQALRVQCLPLDMPRELQVDVSGLKDFEMSIYVKELRVPSQVTVLSDPEELVVRVNPPRRAVEGVEAAEEAPEAVAEEGEEGGG